MRTRESEGAGTAGVESPPAGCRAPQTGSTLAQRCLGRVGATTGGGRGTGGRECLTWALCGRPRASNAGSRGPPTPHPTRTRARTYMHPRTHAHSLPHARAHTPVNAHDNARRVRQPKLLRHAEAGEQALHHLHRGRPLRGSPRDQRCHQSRLVAHPWWHGLVPGVWSVLLPPNKQHHPVRSLRNSRCNAAIPTGPTHAPGDAVKQRKGTPLTRRDVIDTCAHAGKG